MSYINSYCHISNNYIKIDGKVTKSFESKSIDEVIKEIYLSLGLKYSKFHKMDQLSKIAFLGTELMKLGDSEISEYGENDIALLFSNSKSSSATDLKFQASYEAGGIPSPSLFVYTLPNILIGEIAIRNKWYGENMFTVSNSFDSKYYADYCNILIKKNAKAALCGWVNVDNNKIEAFFFFVTQKDLKQLNLPLDSIMLDKIYKQD